MARRRETRVMRDPLPTVVGAGLTGKWYFRHLKDMCGYQLQKVVENVLASRKTFVG